MSFTDLSTADLQAKQLELRDQIYAAGCTTTEGQAFNAVYEETVAELLARLDGSSACGFIDVDLACSYSDFYKDEHGVRPRLVTYTDARSYVDNLFVFDALPVD